MILCYHHIERAVRTGRIVIDPPLEASQLESSALNLRVGDDFRTWKGDLKAAGTKHLIDLDNIDLSETIGLTDPLPANAEGLVIIPPGQFVLVRTREDIDLPVKGRLAARVGIC